MKRIMSNVEWHSIDADAALKMLETSQHGLDEAQVAEREEIYGANILFQKSSLSFRSILAHQLHSPIVYVLIASTLLALLLGKYADSLIIFSVVLLNATIGSIQELRAAKKIKSLATYIPKKSRVVRGGLEKSIPSSHLVPGDIIILESGDHVPADIRFIKCKNVSCDESTLTGESLPVEKNSAPVKKGAPLAERGSMAYNGTFLVSGRAVGLVVATGLASELGKISELIEETVEIETPLSQRIDKLFRRVTVAILGASITLFLIGYLRGLPLFDAGLTAITLAVAAIPEGLPAIMTITAAVGVHQMAKRRAIIRQLSAVEALGSTTVICTDKTGTLTTSEIEVKCHWTPIGRSIRKNRGDKEAIRLFSAALLCSEAKFLEGYPVGDPTEIALIRAFNDLALDEATLRHEYPQIDLLPFEAERRLMASLNREPNGETIIFVKGAPESLLRLCRESIPHDEVKACLHEMAAEGMRVLAVAEKRGALTHMAEDELKEGFTLLGLIGMLDPPREEVGPAIKACIEAGIRVKMVTGDHEKTAEAIGRDLGILGGSRVVKGEEIGAFSGDNRLKLVHDNHVFARVTPEQKLLLVEALQNRGEVVAMTGDGVNDAAALKRADIGIAMGIRGTEVAKEASDIVLIDDNFATIEAAIEEGRHVYDNLVKSLSFILPTSLGQALIVFFSILFFPVYEGHLFHPISPVQVLWINLVVAVALALPLAFEPLEAGTMRLPPRKKREPLLSRSLIVKTLTVAFVMALGTIALFLWEYHRGISQGGTESHAIAEAQTIAVTAIMLFQSFYLFTCRSLRGGIGLKNFFANRVIFASLALVILAQLAFIYLPFMNRLFLTTALDLRSWIISTLIAFLIVPIMLVEKFIISRSTK